MLEMTFSVSSMINEKVYHCCSLVCGGKAIIQIELKKLFFSEFVSYAYPEGTSGLLWRERGGKTGNLVLREPLSKSSEKSAVVI